MKLNYKKMGKKLILLAGIVSCALFSCTYESVIELMPPTLPTQKTEVKFSSRIIIPGPSNSRIIGELWETGDAIGMYMVEKNSYSVVEGSSNIRYVTKKSCYTCNFVASDDFIYYPEDGREVRFMSYYPHNESTKGTTYKIDVSNQIPQSKLAFLYSFNSIASYDKNVDVENVPIEFNHQMTKIHINVKNAGNLQGYDLMNMKVYMTGLSSNADFNLMTGKISNFKKSSHIYPSVLIAENGNVFSAEAIVIPESNLSSDAGIVFDLNNGNKNKKSDVYRWDLGETLEKGKKYTFNVAVNSTGISVNTTIYDWFNISIDEEVGLRDR